MKKKSYLVSITLFATIILSSCGKTEKQTSISKTENEIPVKVISINKSNAIGTIHASGQFTTDDETCIELNK